MTILLIMYQITIYYTELIKSKYIQIIILYTVFKSLKSFHENNKIVFFLVELLKLICHSNYCRFFFHFDHQKCRYGCFVILTEFIFGVFQSYFMPTLIISPSKKSSAYIRSILLFRCILH